MSIRILSCILQMLGAAAVLIGCGIFVFGAEPVAAVFSNALSALPGFGPMPALAAWPSDADNELRFYAVFWAAFGVMLFASGRDMNGKNRQVATLLGLFFLGGIGRIFSILQTGWPHPLFVMLMAVELALPPVLLAMLGIGGPKGAKP